MHQIWNFTKWIVRQLGPFEYSWMIAVGCFSAGLTSGAGIARDNLWAITAVIFIAWMAKWSLWDCSRSLWTRFKKEQQQVVDVLKKDYK